MKSITYAKKMDKDDDGYFEELIPKETLKIKLKERFIPFKIKVEEVKKKFPLEYKYLSVRQIENIYENLIQKGIHDFFEFKHSNINSNNTLKILDIVFNIKKKGINLRLEIICDKQLKLKKISFLTKEHNEMIIPISQELNDYFCLFFLNFFKENNIEVSETLGYNCFMVISEKVISYSCSINKICTIKQTDNIVLV